jgi:hypothetical protein
MAGMASIDFELSAGVPANFQPLCTLRENDSLAGNKAQFVGVVRQIVAPHSKESSLFSPELSADLSTSKKARRELDCALAGLTTKALGQQKNDS